MELGLETDALQIWLMYSTGVF